MTNVDLGFVQVMRSFFADGSAARLGPSAALLYIAIRSHAARGTGLAWPSDASLAKTLGLSPASIRRGLKLLEERGFLTREGNGGPGRRLLTHDQLDIGGDRVGWPHVPAVQQAYVAEIARAVDRGQRLDSIERLTLISRRGADGEQITALEIVGRSAHDLGLEAIRTALGKPDHQ